MLFYVPDLLKLKIQTKLKDFDIFTNFVPLENKCTELARPKNNLERNFFVSSKVWESFLKYIVIVERFFL